MRSRLSVVILIVALFAALAAIWAPGQWWQWLLTSVVLCITAAGVAPAPSKSKSEPSSVFRGQRDE